MTIIRRIQSVRRLTTRRRAMPSACFVSAVRISTDRTVAREMRQL